MSIYIKGNEIYDQHGCKLKTISCPKNITKRNLEYEAKGDFFCKACDRKIYDTDIMTEKQIIKLLKQKPESCLSINLKNPLFERLD